MSNYILTNKDELMHYGVLGQKWGIRRYQNEDKSLTPLGREHYAKEGFKLRAQEMHKTGIGRALGKITREGDRLYNKANEETREKAIKYYQDHLDKKWADKNYEKIQNGTYRKVRSEINNYVTNYLDVKYGGNVNRSYINEYNRQLADLMNKAVGDIQAPSGKVVQYVAKRGEAGVHMALADRGYDMSQLKNGVWGSGKIAYRKNNVDMV